MRNQRTPKLFEPTKVFFALLIVTLYYFAPVSKPVQLPQKTSNKSDRPQPYLGALQVASAQEGCGACQQIGCVEYIWNGADAENGDTTTCTKVGCVAIPACVPNPPTASISVSCDAPGTVRTPFNFAPRTMRAMFLKPQPKRSRWIPSLPA